ncbi:MULTISPECIES: glutathione ABC transporter permease GsiD [unclassified Serratia (in: enterobacteria)]|uniref:glutathione ABC transporter permease GsiD n=1 Tax=unclassified Serratia (in: enterobacteria) TaxID=2647522 RepID=UPI002ED23E0F|nr:glutathione ABC transporter permease GsiD [Serratia sp. C2(2)]MEE4447416.1 glutathione ABC transporter permease GsiD [Serratia sp. C2(1)]
MIKHWRRNAALKAMPTINPNAVRTPWHEFWRRFRRQHVALVAGLFVLLLVAAALFAPYLAPFDAENYFDYDRLNEGPSPVHWLGVDSLGRDIFSRILMGTRISLAAGVFSVLAGGFIGTLLGLLAGYYEGWWDRITMRICDVLFAFPGILLAIGVVAIMGSGMANVIIAVAIFSIPAFARLVRGNTLVQKHLTYIESARSIGASDWTIIMRHILPGTLSSIVVYFTMRIGTSIITAASLSFLGLGAQPPTPEWGAMLNEARADMVIAPHVAIFPSLAIFLTVLAFNLLGDGLRDALDPKLKG